MAALKAEKPQRIYREQASGGRWDRPELQRLASAPQRRCACDEKAQALADKFCGP